MDSQTLQPVVEVKGTNNQNIANNGLHSSISSDKLEGNTKNDQIKTNANQDDASKISNSLPEKISKNIQNATMVPIVKGSSNQSGEKKTDTVPGKIALDGESNAINSNEKSNNSGTTVDHAPTNGKRGRETAFDNRSVLEGAPEKSIGTNPKLSSSLNSSNVIEPPQKLPRIDSTNTSEEKNKDGNSSDNSSYDGSMTPPKRLSGMASSSLEGSTIIGPTNDPKSEPHSNGIHHKAAKHLGNNDEFESPECDEYFLSLVNLDPIPDSTTLPRLLPREVAQLEHNLQIGPKYKVHSDDYTWRDDWNGNLQLVDKDLIMNRDTLANNPMAKPITIPFSEWVAKFARHSDDFNGVKLLFSYVYNMKGTPPMARRIMSHYLQRPASSIAERLKFIEEATQRISYDPIVLKQDGWTTAKTDAPDGATGGAYMIGRKILWQRTEAIVVAFVRDDGLGDLWKCMWVEDLDTFDLEADELQEGIKRWERKIFREKNSNKKTTKLSKTSSSSRFEQNRNFTVKGIEDGIILATSYKAKNGRPWPARVMHITEIKAMGQLTSRRSSSKNEIHVVFLAPYWNSQATRTTNAKSSFSTGPLFELETIDVSEDTIQEYPYDIKSDTLPIEKLQSAFGFLGLPKSAYPRYLDSHRIAAALKSFANNKNFKSAKTLDTSSHLQASASLADTHPLSVQTFSFPDALLNLPFEYTLEKYPSHGEKAGGLSADSGEITEPIMKLGQMLDALCPPRCWGQDSNESKVGNKIESPYNRELTPTKPEISTPKPGLAMNESFAIQNFCSEFFMGSMDYYDNDGKLELGTIKKYLEDLVLSLNESTAEVESVANPLKRREKLRNFLLMCIFVKGQGEEYLYGPNFRGKISHRRKVVLEWRKACERIFKRALVRMGHINAGNGTTAIITDARCNQHITAKGSFERAVRLPAAIRGAKNAGAGAKPSMPLITKIEDAYMKVAEQKIIPMAHKGSYLRRLKTKIAALKPDAKGEPLTDDSDGEGGEDTKGSRGSYTAAVTGVAAALKGVDMVVGGSCVNSFCAIRPPGHHAGRELRPMNAISNGFCLLNPAACAALYATSPLSEGGLGLKRVCVVDIDVHHGNGTQDVLASTYDPRFLYISTHAGGPHINGYSDDKSDDGIRRSLNNKDGIFPGRCGDTSPHKGVLNLPLGQKITPSALGTALVCQVTPAIEQFSPELIIISAGFDAHKNDPLGLGGLSAEDFGTVTKVLCQVALNICSGRVISILEGGYGVPCCRPLEKDLFLPNSNILESTKKPLKLLKLGDDLPESMEDPVDLFLSQKLDKCHQEGFMECVKHHVSNLATSSNVEPRT